MDVFLFLQSIKYAEDNLGFKGLVLFNRNVLDWGWVGWRNVDIYV